jgi:hypothetical protein
MRQVSRNPGHSAKDILPALEIVPFIRDKAAARVPAEGFFFTVYTCISRVANFSFRHYRAQR